MEDSFMRNSVGRRLFDLIIFVISVVLICFTAPQTAPAQSAVAIRGQVNYFTNYPPELVPAGNVTVVMKRYDPRQQPPLFVGVETTTTSGDGTFAFNEARPCEFGWLREFQAISSEVIDGETLRPSNFATSEGCSNDDIRVGNLQIDKPYRIRVGGTVYLNDWQTRAAGTFVRMVRTKQSNQQATVEYTRTDANGYFEFSVWSGSQEIIISGNPDFSASVSVSGLTEDKTNLAFIVPQIIPDFPNAGTAECSKNTAVGGPVNVTNGNMYIRQTDYILPGFTGTPIDVSRTYNSMDPFTGVFGAGWRNQYDEALIYYDQYSLQLVLPDGKSMFFARDDQNPNLFNPSIPDFYAQITRNSDSTFTINFKDGRVHQFASNGRLLSQKDRNGNQTSLSYTNGSLTGITDPFGRSVVLTPNANGTVQQITDSLGVVATYAYYPATALLKTVAYADGSKYEFEYTTIGGKTYLATVKDALDNILETHQYDSSGRATTSEKHGGIEKYTLDYSHWSDSVPYTRVTDANQKETKYFFKKSEGRNLVTKTEGVCGCGGSGSEVTSFEFDHALNMTKKTDALSHETLYTYDSFGNRLSMTDATGTETYTYNTFGEILTRTDPMNGTTTLNYDARGNLLNIHDALNQPTTFTFDSRGMLQTMTNAKNKTTRLTYDAEGRLTQVTDARNHSTVYGYDARARVTSVTNALNKVTSFEYDPANRLKKIIFPGGKSIEQAFDLAGRSISTTDARGKVTGFSYDAAYRLTAVTDPLSHVTGFGYDPMSNLSSTTDALGNTVNFEYDDFNRIAKITYPPASAGATRLVDEFEYDAIGNLKKRVDTANRETLYEYDNANRLIKTIAANLKQTQIEYNQRSEITAVIDAMNQRYEFAFDALGRLLSQSRAGSTRSFEYDAVGNQTKRIDYNGAVTNYIYDNLNRLKKINYVANSNENASYTFDALSRLKTATNQTGTIAFSYNARGGVADVTDEFGQTLVYTYDANGNRKTVSLNGTSLSYVYDAANRLQSITNSDDNTTVDFNYDAANRLTKKILPNGITTSYVYDGMSRLTRIRDFVNATNTTVFNRQYSYNPANQISRITQPTGVKNFVYDVLDRLTGVTGSNSETYAYDAVGNRTSSQLSSSYSYQPFNRLTNTATASYGYDSNGNLISRTDASGTWTYEYDSENRLKKAAKPTGENVIYKYNALGQRTERIEGANATRFTYDGSDVMLDQNTSGANVKYVNGSGIDDKLRQTVNGQAQYFLTDHLGSTTGLVDSGGALLSQANYDSFGNSTNALPTRYQYTGREKDDLSGLYYYRARWYDPHLGRFTSEDPIGLVGGINQFAYVGNNSVNAKDPTGLFEKDVHYYLTYYLAKRTGCFSEGDAREIAEGNQATDEEEDKYPGRGRSGPNAVYHALHPNATAGTASPLLMYFALNPKPDNRRMGNALHYLQDSFSHEGYSDSYWGHAKAGHYYDKTNSDPEKAMRMAEATWDALMDFGRRKGCECNSSMDSATREAVDLFNRSPGANFGYLNTIDSSGGYLDFGIVNPPIYMQNKKLALGIYE